MGDWRIINADAIAGLRQLGDESAHCCVTSPPYWGLRDYQIDGQLGLEALHDCLAWARGVPLCGACYVCHMVAVFREVRRVLRSDGACFLNLGDSYATGAGKVGSCPGGGEQGDRWKGDNYGGHRGSRGGSSKQPHAGANIGPLTQPNRMPLPGLKPKDMVGIPWRVALALQADGWWLRSDIVWAKGNPMPESVQGSHYFRHRVTIEEYEKLSILPKGKCDVGHRPCDVQGVQAREVSNCEAAIPAKREGASNGTQTRGTRGREGEAQAGQSLTTGAQEQGEIRGDAEGAADSAQGTSPLSSDGSRETEGVTASPEDEASAITHRTEEARGCDVSGNTEGCSAETAGLRQTKGRDCARPIVDHSGLAGHRNAQQGALFLLQGEEAADDRPCNSGEQGRKARQGERGPCVSDLQLGEGEQVDDVDLVDCPGCPKCSANDGYVLRMSAGRPTKSHEYIFLLAKSARYFWDAGAVKEPDSGQQHARNVLDGAPSLEPSGGLRQPHGNLWGTPEKNGQGRNIRTVWTVNTSPFPEAHFATWPPALVEPMIKAGTSEKGCCPQCGAPWARVVTKPFVGDQRAGMRDRDLDEGASNGKNGQKWWDARKVQIEAALRNATWKPTCGCERRDVVPCVVVDPFCGSGTTGVVALRLGRSFRGIDLSADYCAMAERRVIGDAPLFNTPAESEQAHG